MDFPWKKSLNTAYHLKKKSYTFFFIDVIQFIHSIEFLLNINIHFEW